MAPRRWVLAWLALLLGVGGSAPGIAANWPQFRGPLGRGVADDRPVPSNWGPHKHVRWRAVLPARGSGSPVVWGEKVFLTVATSGGRERSLLCFERSTGKRLWSCTRLGPLVYPSCVAANGLLVAVSGYHAPMMGLRLGGTGDVTAKNRLWITSGKQPQRVGSGVVVGKHIYMANAGPATIECIHVETGEVAWRAGIPGGPAWGSVVAAAGRLYVTTRKGYTVVFAPNPATYEQLAVNGLGEPSDATPAIVDGQIFLRTTRALYCIEAP